MKRSQLEHIIRAAGSIAEDDEIIIIGSASVLAQFPDTPEEVLLSIEADLFPRNKPQMADLIDGTIGELSPFHQAFGYYALGGFSCGCLLCVSFLGGSSSWASGDSSFGPFSSALLWPLPWSLSIHIREFGWW
jgi:hypothetical protein